MGNEIESRLHRENILTLLMEFKEEYHGLVRQQYEIARRKMKEQSGHSNHIPALSIEEARVRINNEIERNSSDTEQQHLSMLDVYL